MRTYHDLQLNITHVLDASEKHNLAESHLESYNSATEYIQQIRTREKAFNSKVSKFANEIPSLIVNTVKSVNSSFHEYSASDNDTMCYARSNIGGYLFNCAQNIPLELILDEQPRQQARLLIDQGRDFVAIGDKDVLKNVKMALEKLRDEILVKVGELMQERITIAQIYDGVLKPIINNIVSSIVEEEPINGGCGLSYCPKPKTKSAQPKNPQ